MEQLNYVKAKFDQGVEWFAKQSFSVQVAVLLGSAAVIGFIF